MKSIKPLAYWKEIAVSAMVLAFVALGLKIAEFKYRFMGMGKDWYLGVIVVAVLVFGVWFGLKWNRRQHFEQATGENNIPAIESFEFSNREKEVYDLILSGYSNKEISDKLFISISTVKTHVSNILNKTNSTSRSQVIAKNSAAIPPKVPRD